MDFSKFDFSAISRMMDSLSEDQKQQIFEEAQNLMNRAPETVEPEEEEEVDLFSFYNIEEDKYRDLNGNILDLLDDAKQLEEFYEDVQDQDYSAVILFLEKALYQAAEEYLKPYLHEQGIELSLNNRDLYSYIQAIQSLDNNHLSKYIPALFSVYGLVKRAETGPVSKQDLEYVKDILFTQELLKKFIGLSDCLKKKL